jgi:hypothetical protein
MPSQGTKTVLEGYKKIADLEPRHEKVESIVYSLNVEKEHPDYIVVAAVKAVEANCMPPY